MSIIYKSQRVGKNNRVFDLYKFRTLKEGTTSNYVHEEYTKYGKFLRKYRLDEIPQLWNVLKGDMALVGPRPDTLAGWAVIEPEIRRKILSVKPGLFGISGVFFFNEEKILAMAGSGATQVFWTRIKPMKFVLDSFYVENKCWSLDLLLVYLGVKTVFKEFLKYGRKI